jgi:hypothetical protein
MLRSFGGHVEVLIEVLIVADLTPSPVLIHSRFSDAILGRSCKETPVKLSPQIIEVD